jgi:hypothetical protein
MSTSTDHVAVLNPAVERRFYQRVTPSSPIYVAFGPNNLGTLLNVSENGLLVATPSGLDVNSVFRVFLTLDGSPSAITVSVRTIWTDKSQNSSGIQLLDLSEQNREQIREWVAAQTYRSEHLDDWVSPTEQEPSPDTRAPAPSEPPRSVAESPVADSRVAQSQNKPAFPPMPLPIHGEFTYEPPPGRLKEVVPVRRRNNAVRSNSRSSPLAIILWTIVVAAVCFSAVWAVRNNAWSIRDKASAVRNKVSDLFLHRPTQVASEGGPQSDQSPSPAVSGGPTTPAKEPASPSAIDHGSKVGASPSTATSSPTGAPRALPPSVEMSKQLEPTARATNPNSGTVQKRTIAPEASLAPRSYEAYSKAIDSAPRPAPTKNTVPVQAPAAEDLPAPAITAPDTAAPAPAPPAQAAANAATRTATTSSSANSPAANDSVAKTSSGDALSRKSAIVGSISNSPRAGNFSAAKPSDTASVSASPPTAVAPRADSYVAPRSNLGSAGVIQMDVPEARVIEIKPPRNLTGSFTSSLVSLPGERVIRSAFVTLHIQRSVRVPRERIPGERWLWRGHEKVAVGELSSRVDPQLPQLATSFGSITIEASIDKDGYVTEVKPLHGSFALLPNAARAIREWRYEPTYLNDKAVETQAKIEIDFHPTAPRAYKP